MCRSAIIARNAGDTKKYEAVKAQLQKKSKTERKKADGDKCNCGGTTYCADGYCRLVPYSEEVE